MKKTANLFLVILCLIILILVGCSRNEEKNAQETVKDFVMDLYTVDIKEVENYKSLLNLNPLEVMDSYDEVQINDEVLKSLMTDDAYETLLKNRENLKFTEICYRENYTMQVAEIELSEHKNDIENNEVGYNFEVQLKLISNDSTEIVGSAKGTVDLGKTNGNWKITGYRYIFPDLLREQ